MDFLNALWAYIVLSAPYLLIGFAASGILHEYFNVEWIKKHLGKMSMGSVIKASAFGVPLPLCSCAVIPAAVTLKKQGASNAATSSFLISTPESGVDSIAMTYGVMDGPMTIIRPIAAFITAFVAGTLQHLFNRESTVKEEGPQKSGCCAHGGKPKAKSMGERLGNMFTFASKDLIEDIAGWLTVGLICGALINYAIPADMFASSNAWWGRLLILAIGIPFYICASASTPIAASMVMKGMSPGTALIFLLVGPATNVANLAVLQKYIGKKGVMINIAAIAVVSLVLSLIVDFMYLSFKWSVDFGIAEVHNHGSPWWNHIMGIVLIFLLGKALFINHVQPLFSPKQKSCH